MKNSIKIYSVLAITFLLSGLSFAGGSETNRQGAHTLSFGYSPVLRSSWYKEWKTIPPLKFSLNYAYDIPMRSRVVNFYAIGEFFYMGACDKGTFTTQVPFKLTFNRIALSAGMGLKFHLVSFLDLVAFYTGGYTYISGITKIPGYDKLKSENHDFLGCAGVRFIGQINKINVFAGYSFTHMAPTDYYHNLEHYVDIGVGYTF